MWRAVTVAFLEDDQNVRVDVASRTLWLTKILSWFAKVSALFTCHRSAAVAIAVLLRGGVVIRLPHASFRRGRDFAQWRHLAAVLTVWLTTRCFYCGR